MIESSAVRPMMEQISDDREEVKMRNQGCILIGFLALIAAGLAACQAPPAIERVQAPVEGKNIVFGRVDVRSSNRPAEWVTSCTDQLYRVCPDDFEIWVVRSGSRELTSHRLTMSVPICPNERWVVELV